MKKNFIEWLGTISHRLNKADADFADDIPTKTYSEWHDSNMSIKNAVINIKRMHAKAKEK